jgi:uncharacterized protein YjiS (DUF1127 family)
MTRMFRYETLQGNTLMEMIMSTIPNAPTAAQGAARYSWASGLAATLKRRRAAYITWRIEQAAITQLWSMSDLELKDIGLTRSNITGAVRGESTRDRASSLSCFSNAPDECLNQRQEAGSGTQQAMAHVG